VIRPSERSQCGRLLRLLETGEWWSCRELLREVPCIVHSRMSDLRSFGWPIEHETRGVGAGGSFYRLKLSEGRSDLSPPVQGGDQLLPPRNLEQQLKIGEAA
jgi:hypothetical protein